MANSLKPYFGIDFGTTNTSVVSVSEIDQISHHIFYGDNERRPIPSVVAIDKQSGEIHTGRDAWERRSVLSQTCEYITSIKSLLTSDWSKTIAGTTWTPDLIAAEIFKTVQATVYERTNNHIDEAVVAIPVGLRPDKRHQIRKAAALAGISIKSFISEPTAAFFANFEAVRGDSTVVVFDWGGGTLDVSVLKNDKGMLYELATEGLDVAGDAIDLKLAQKVHSIIARKKGLHKHFDEMAPDKRDALLVKVENAKKNLADNDTATVFIRDYGEFGPVSETINFDWFSEVISSEINAAIDCLYRAIRMSGQSMTSIDRVILVGGSSNLRPLIDKLYDIFADRLYSPEETMWNVGVGAALTNLSPGEYYSNQYVSILLSDNSIFNLLLPMSKLKDWSSEHSFGIVDNCGEVRIVFTGCTDIDESPIRYHSLKIPSYNFLQEQIKIRAYVDENLIFNVSAKSSMRTHELTGRWQYDKLRCSYRLPDNRQ